MTSRLPIIKRQSGMTMVELMVTTGLVGGLILVVSVLMVSMSKNSAALNDRMIFDQDLELLQSAIERPFRTAVNVQFAAGPLPAASSLTGPGLVAAPYDSTTQLNNAGVDLLALFFRENNVIPASATSVSSKFTPTAIYFQRPQKDTYGILYVMSGPQGNGTLAPSRGGVTFEKITSIKFSAPPGSPTYPRSLEIDVEMRYPSTTTISEDPTQNNVVWCPSGQVGTAACPRTLRSYRDITRHFVVDLKNNIDPLTTQLDNFMFGRLYFLK